MTFCKVSDILAISVWQRAWVAPSVRLSAWNKFETVVFCSCEQLYYTIHVLTRPRTAQRSKIFWEAEGAQGVSKS